MKINAKILVALGVLSALFIAGGAAAKWSRNAAAYCQVLNTNTSAAHWLTSGVWVRSGHSGLQLYCPLKDTWDFPKSQLDHINVHVHDGTNTGGATARACATFAFSLGGACETGPSTSSPFQGSQTLTIQGNQIDFLTANAQATNFAYLYVALPRGSALKGYWTSD